MLRKGFLPLSCYDRVSSLPKDKVSKAQYKTVQLAFIARLYIKKQSYSRDALHRNNYSYYLENRFLVLKVFIKEGLWIGSCSEFHSAGPTTSNILFPIVYWPSCLQSLLLSLSVILTMLKAQHISGVRFQSIGGVK